MSRLHYVKPKSYIAVLYKEHRCYRPENNLHNLEARAKAAKGDTYHLLKYKDHLKLMV